MKEDFVYPPSINTDIPFWIELAGTSYCDGSYKILRPSSACMCVEFVLKGEGTIVIGGEAYTAKEGDTYILPPGKDHLYYSSAKNPWQKIWFNARGSYLINSLLDAYNPSGRVVFEGICTKEYIEKIHSVLQDESKDAYERHSECVRIFMELLQFSAHNSSCGSEKACSELETLTKYIDTHINEQISLPRMSKIVHLSVSQINRIFLKYMGVAPYEYILSKRFDLANKLLRNTTMQISEIAFATGFTDEHYFSSVYKKKNGCTPTEYRKKQL